MLALKTFNSLFELMIYFKDEESCIAHLELLRWKDGVISPFDENSSVYKCSGNRYKCRSTNKYFNVRTGTIFEGSKIPLLKWFFAIYMVSSHKKGISSHQLARDISITQKSAWFMLHRIRTSMEHQVFSDMLSGIVEADETFVGGKNKNRHHDKKVAQSQGRSFKDKVPVLGLLQRGGDLFAKVIKDTKSKSVQPLIHQNVELGSTLVTDEWWAYKGLGKYYDHQVIDHSIKQYFDGDAYTNSIEGAWSWLKRMIIGIYHKTSKKHLQLYVNEFVFKYNSRKFGEAERFNDLLNRCFYRRLTYQELKYDEV